MICFVKDLPVGTYMRQMAVKRLIRLNKNTQVFDPTYVTVPEKRVLVAQIMIFRYRRFSATTPKNSSRDKTFVFVSEESPTLYLHSR